MSNRIPFQKPYTSAHDLVSLLQSRSLTITDSTKAEQYLEYIGYYRLSAYMYPLLQMPKEQHRYKPNTSFDQVMTLYRFDKKLRLLIFNEIAYPPACILAEVLPFGVITNIFSNIKVARIKKTLPGDLACKIDALLSAYPSIDTAAMGFPRGWENEPLWQ